jgi:hypothetical protein
MTIPAVTILEVKENEDGSADIEFEVDDPIYQKTLMEEGLSFVLLKAAYGLTTEELVEMLEKAKGE